MNIAELEATVTCPDCSSETKLIRLANRMYTAAVLHDDTCPWLTSKRSRRT